MSEKLDIKLGDLVCVNAWANTGSPTMIVDGFDPSLPGQEILVACYWFRNDKTYQRASFRVSHLVKQ
jgi:uncharacterized protein YodC (DUF2158 family)